MEKIQNNELQTQSGLLDLGNQPVSETIQRVLLSSDDDTDIIMINALTICRNTCCSTYSAEVRQDIISKNQLEECVDHILHTLQLLVASINTCYSKKFNFPVPRYVVVYTFDYEKMIPPTYYRPLSDKFISQVENRLKARVTERGCVKYGSNNMLMEFYPETDVPSYVSLYKLIQQFKNRHNVLMVSHHPIDYHLAGLVNKWKSVSSFTGSIKTPNNLSEMVYGTEYIPFNQMTHILFGDRVDMKQTIKRGSKKSLAEIAQKESWQLMSEEKLAERFSQLQIIPPYTI